MVVTIMLTARVVRNYPVLRNATGSCRPMLAIISELLLMQDLRNVLTSSNTSLHAHFAPVAASWSSRGFLGGNVLQSAPVSTRASHFCAVAFLCSERSCSNWAAESNGMTRPAKSSSLNLVSMRDVFWNQCAIDFSGPN